MVIRRSAATEIRELVDRLVRDDPAAREGASARLAVIGARAGGALLKALDATRSPGAQAAILRTLEAIHEPHSIPAAARSVDSQDIEVALAALGILRSFLRYQDAALANAAFERVTSVTLDPTRPEPVRAAALEALSDLPAQTTEEVLRQLEHDPDRTLKGVAANRRPLGNPPATLAEVTRASLCPEPVALRRMIEREGGKAPLPVLGKLVDLVRAREEGETASGRRTEWQAVRAAIHQVLADRGSRVAVYDLRESLAVAPGPLPVGFLAALERIGNASCLDEVAAAYLRARAARDAWWTGHLASAFRTIVRRERLTRRSPDLKRVLAKYPQAGDDLLPPRR
jgi:hypothetical protein